jgi:diguanylate cyclase (GGDEF)-like protein
MTSPFFYIVFSLMLSSCALSVAFYIAYANFGRQRHALTWAVAFLFGALQFGTTLNAQSFPSEAIYLLTENACAIMLITLGVRGHCQRTNCRIWPRKMWPVAGAVFLVAWFFTVIYPHAGLVSAVAPAYASFALLLSSWIILAFRARTRPSEWAAAISIALFGVTQALAAFMSIQQGAVHDGAQVSAFMHFMYLTLPAGYITTSMLIILMMASDISAEMKELAVRDQLTGLFNRRGFTELSEQAYAMARRTNTPLALVMTDIDRFKFINDKFGHAAGDAALQHFAGLVLEDRRRNDVVARVGGEEFAILLPGTQLEDAMVLANQLCQRIELSPVVLTSARVKMTSSFGVATISSKDTTVDDMIRRADRALYRSKHAGRNQVDLESSQLVRRPGGQLKPVGSA